MDESEDPLLLSFGVAVTVVVTVALLPIATRGESRVNPPPFVQQLLVSPQHHDPSPHDVTLVVQFDFPPAYFPIS